MLTRDARLYSVALVLGFATGATAQIVSLGGPLKPGEARPPLWASSEPASTTSSAPPYTPAQIRHAYGFDKLSATGTGQTIAIVDAYGSSTLQKDLNKFCSTFGLPGTTVAIYYPQGRVGSERGWSQETSLDVQWAHAIAPGARLAVVVAKSPAFSDLLGAVDYSVKTVHAHVVSMSWGGAESPDESGTDSHFNVPGVTFVAASGDNGESSGPEYPAASPFVVSVGATSLRIDASGNYLSETAWSGSGGGISAYEYLPAFQVGWQRTSFRTVPDVSYVGDPNTGIYVVVAGRYYEFGGTSVGTPQWAALIAIANSLRISGTLNRADSAIYLSAGPPPHISASYFRDITSGNDGSDPDDFAVPGYDFVTGLGTPIANNLAISLRSR